MSFFKQCQVKNSDADSAYGLKKEKEMFPIIKKFIKDDTLKLIEYKYSLHDYGSKMNRVELKSRHNKMNSYNTTIVSVNKMESFRVFNGDAYFFFNFYDGLFVIKYDSEVFDTFRQQTITRTDRGKVESGLYVLIPVSLLTKIC
jgi:hypothetical protein